MWKKILLGFLVFLIVIQFIRQKKNLGQDSGPNDFLVRHRTTPEIQRLLETACYDCHSNQTNYPWYAEVQPVGWWLASHISDGTKHINFSEFGTLPEKRAARKLQQCADEVTDGGMPLSSYTLIHADARLTAMQRKLLSDWFDTVRTQIPVETAK